MENGLALDFCSQHGLQLDPANPFGWDFRVPAADGLPWRAAFPKLAAALGPASITGSFDGFAAVLGHLHSEDPRDVRLDAEARQFIAFAYSFLQQEIDRIGLDRWRWSKWVRQYASSIAAAVSLNYDLLLESAFQRAQLRAQRHSVANENAGVLFLKPHGSIDFEADPRNISVPKSSSPLENWVTLNDTGLVALSRDELRKPRQEAFVVLPFEYSPYLNYQWVAPGYARWRREASSFTHCVFAGLSYWTPDRDELDLLLDTLSPTARVIVANPNPPDIFAARVAASGRPYTEWRDGPAVLC